MSEHPSLLRPIPRRHFDFTPSSTEPPTPRTSSQESRTAAEPESDVNGSALKLSDRTRSVLNLTSSTLFGIYAPSGSPKDSSSTPWPPGFETPGPRASIDDNKPPVIGAYDGPQMYRRSSQPPVTVRNYYVPLTLRAILLFLFGVSYGSIVTHLHDNQQIAPVKVEGIDRYTWRYLAFWGFAGVLLGRLLPWIDLFWERTLGDDRHSMEAPTLSEDAGPQEAGGDGDQRSSTRLEGVLGADWNPAVRSIGAFVGIAFAIRKLPWQSTLQVSLTLAMVNPALWYLIDRSKPGLFLSALVGVAGTAVLLGVNPSIVPAPPAPSHEAHGATSMNTFYDYSTFREGRLISNESIAVSTWIASVLFCSSVCFGNIGRQLALDRRGRTGKGILAE
ncbi:MAG: hypothetical protein Q9211_001051 [Gyalolechia sp. 1 TL-2023]